MTSTTTKTAATIVGTPGKTLIHRIECVIQMIVCFFVSLFLCLCGIVLPGRGHDLSVTIRDHFQTKKGVITWYFLLGNHDPHSSTFLFTKLLFQLSLCPFFERLLSPSYYLVAVSCYVAHDTKHTCQVYPVLRKYIVCMVLPILYIVFIHTIIGNGSERLDLL